MTNSWERPPVRRAADGWSLSNAGKRGRPRGIAVDPWRTRGDGWRETKTTCRGGAFGGITCYNGPGDPFCLSTDAVSLDHGTRRWSVAKVVTVLETGSAAQLAQAAEAIQAEVAFEPGMTTALRTKTTSNRADRQTGQHVTGRHGQQHRDHGHRR